MMKMNKVLIPSVLLSLSLFFSVSANAEQTDHWETKEQCKIAWENGTAAEYQPAVTLKKQTLKGWSITSPYQKGYVGACVQGETKYGTEKFVLLGTNFPLLQKGEQFRMKQCQNKVSYILWLTQPTSVNSPAPAVEQAVSAPTPTPTPTNTNTNINIVNVPGVGSGGAPPPPVGGCGHTFTWQGKSVTVDFALSENPTPKVVVSAGGRFVDNILLDKKDIVGGKVECPAVLKLVVGTFENSEKFRVDLGFPQGKLPPRNK